MVTTGGTRGYLRTGFGRSPPLLLIALILISGISVFNYWNLSAQYSDVVKEISELQEHIRILASKHETSEKLVESLHKKLRDSEDQVGKMKVNLGEKNVKLNDAEKQIGLKNEEIHKLKTSLKQSDDLSKRQPVEELRIKTLKDDITHLKLENNVMKEKNAVLQKTLANLKVEMSVMKSSQHFMVPNIVKSDPSKTDKQDGGITEAVKKELNESEDQALPENEMVTEKVDDDRAEDENLPETPVTEHSVSDPRYELQAEEAIQSAIDSRVPNNPIVENLKFEMKKSNVTPVSNDTKTTTTTKPTNLQ